MESVVGCFGKLPFHREFLRIGLDSAAGTYVVRLVEEAHAALTRSPPAGDARGAWARLAIPRPEGLLLAAVRRSTDGLRRHPIAFFVQGPAVPADSWMLVPWAAGVPWAALEALADEGEGSVDELMRRAREGVPGIALEGLREQWDAMLACGVSDPWRHLIGARDDLCQHAALNFLTLCRAQGEAGEAEAGVAMILPLPEDGARASAYAGVWIRLIEAGLGVRSAPTIAMLDGPRRLVLFLRPLTGRDVGTLIGSITEGAIDDLIDPWQTFPPADPAMRTAVDRLLDPAPSTLPALASRLSGWR